MSKNRYKNKSRYDILEPINREDWRESMSQIVYAVVSKAFYNKLIELKKNNMNWKIQPYIEKGILGEGAYFFIDNLDYAKNYANEVGGIVMKTEIEVKNALNLLTSSVGQQQLQTLLKNSVTAKLKNDKHKFDILIEESTVKYDSIIGIMVDTKTKIDSCDMVYGYMSRIICVKDYSCIKGYKEIIDKLRARRSNSSSQKPNRPNR